MLCKVRMRYRKTHPDAKTPTYARAGDSGMDLRTLAACIINPGEVRRVETGVAFEIPDGYEMQIRLRSGVALRLPLVMPNAPATIDNGYRGSVAVIVCNVSTSESVHIGAGERIAQAVLCPVVQADLVETREPLPATERGAAGFGHSGIL